MKKIVDLTAGLLTLVALIWAADILRLFGIAVYTEQYIALMLAMALPLVYLTVPARRLAAAEAESEGEDTHGKSRTNVPWYDIVAATVGCLLSLYAMVQFPELSLLVAKRPLEGLIPAIIMLLLFLEGVRRSSGPIIAMVAIGIFALAFVGHLLPTEISGRKIIPDHFVFFLFWDSSAVMGPVLEILTTIVVAFVFFGTVLFNTGGAAFFTDASAALMGRYRGGQAKISIAASSLFGTISGSVVANVVTTGVVTIPMMKAAGFRARLAGAIEAVASTGGQLLPPVMGITAFVMAEFLQVQYAEVALAALIPALLFYFALFFQADLEAARGGMRGLKSEDIPSAKQVLLEGWFFPIPFIVLIVTLFKLNYQPQTSALLASLSVIVTVCVFGYQGKRPSLGNFFLVFRDTGMKVLDIFMVGAAAGIVIATLNYSGLGFGLTLALLHLANDSLIALLVIAAVACIILGMGMPTTGVYILLAALIAPALIEMGIEPMAAHLFILYFGCLSMITPPVAIGAFAAANIARADPMATGVEAVRFGWAVFLLPVLFVTSNSFLLEGPVSTMILNISTAVIGIMVGSAGFVGFGISKLSNPIRIVYFAVGACFLCPVEVGAYGLLITAAGVVALVVLILIEISKRKRHEQHPPSFEDAL